MEHRLAVIMATDIVGYSRMMARDEAATVRMLRRLRSEVLDPVLRSHAGQLTKLMGDGALVEFPSAHSAAAAALDLRDRIAGDPALAAISLRIGITLGDVVVEEGDFYGDGVNVAARLQAIAAPGTIAVSEKIRAEIANDPAFHCLPLGRRRLPKMDGTTIVWDLRRPGERASRRIARLGRLAAASAGVAAVLALALGLALDGDGALSWLAPTGAAPGPASASLGPAEADKAPTIAVMPFQNLSGDPDERYFSDGITIDLITDLSQVSRLAVIAWSSSSRFGQEDPIATVSRQLGADFVLNGSVRRAGNSVRINAELFEAGSGANIWAERFDREMTQVFAMQDDVVRQIVDALKVELTPEEESRLAVAPETDPEIYDLMLRGRAEFNRLNEEGFKTGEAIFREVLRREPDNARALSNLGFLLSQRTRLGLGQGLEHDTEESLSKTARAVELDPDLPWIHFARAGALISARRMEEARKHARRSVELDPNYADGYTSLAQVNAYSGRPQEGLEAMEHAFRLNPIAPFFYYWIRGHNHFVAGNLEAAEADFTQALEQNQESGFINLYLAATLALLDRVDDAEWQMEEVRILIPDFTLEDVREVSPYLDDADLDRLLDGLRRAGMSEG